MGGAAGIGDLDLRRLGRDHDGGGDPARPVVPIMVSSLVVVFSVVELLVLPLAAREFLCKEPLVAAAWMGLAVKTDGAAVASGAITDATDPRTALESGVAYEAGWILTTTTTVKVFIDVFIGVWALVLALVWTYGIEKKPGAKVPVRDVLKRFPAFVFGYFALFLVFLGLTLARPAMAPGLAAATAQTEPLRGLFFALTFFTIGLASDVKRLWAEGIGRLALVYAVSLFGFIIWIGLLISWLFFHGRIHRRFREVLELVDRSREAETQAEPSLAEELAAIPYEPLLPVEKWLIGVSLVLGVSLLAILSWVSANYFPVAPSPTAARSPATQSQPTASSNAR